MQPFRIRPSERLHPDFPWQAFAAGWLAIGKGVAWLFSELAIPGEAGRLILLHLSLFTIGFVICGIGVWNLRRWAQIGIIALSSANMAIFFFYNYYAVLGLQHESFFFAKTFMLITGPLGDIGLLGLVIAGSSYFGKDHGIKQ